MAKFRPRNTPRARALRNTASPAERIVWRYLSGGATGAKFSRQMPVGPYFADFLCRELKLMIELDGYSHDLRPGHDAARDRWMRAQGYRVVRFANAQVMADMESVMLGIMEAVRECREGRDCPPRCD